jgi:hypothetical protein
MYQSAESLTKRRKGRSRVRDSQFSGHVRVLLCALLVLMLLPAGQAGSEEKLNLPDKLGPTHMKAAGALERGELRDVLIILQGMEDPEARLLKGMARFGLKEYAASARDLAAYRQRAGSRYAYFDKEEKELYVDSLNMLMLAYYHSDQLPESLEASDELMRIKYTRELAEFQARLRRELRGNSTRLSEASDHFKVIYDGYEHGKVDRKVLSILEDAYREVGREMDHFPSSPVTVVLDTRSQFHDITQSPGWAGGVFKDGRIRIPVGGLESFNESEVKRVLKHEYVHALIYSITPECPRWVHEGMAEYLSRGPGAARGKPRIPLRLLESAFYSPDVRAVAMAYQDSFHAVKAIVDNYGMYDIKLFLEALGRGEDAEEAFRRRFYVTYDQFIVKFGG